MKDSNTVPVAVETETETSDAISSIKPALTQIGVYNCPFCANRVAVLLTRNRRPFINCGYCSARIFFNGKESIRLLMKTIAPILEKSEHPIESAQDLL